MSYQNFIAILANSQAGTPPPDNRIFLQKNVLKLCSDYAQLTPGQQNKLVATLEGVTKGAPSSGGAFAASLLFHLTGKTAYLRQALTIYETLNLSACDYINDYFTIRDLVFTSPALIRDQIVTESYLKQIYRKAVDLILEEYHVPDNFEPVPGRVVVLLDQLLDKGHAPTFRALSFVKILKDQFKKEVLLVNTCMFSALNSGSIARRKLASVTAGLSQMTSADFAGTSIDLFQPTPPILTNDTLQAVISRILDFRPSGVLAVGNQCAVAEVFAERCFTLCSPLNNDVVPESIAVRYHSHLAAAQTDEHTGQGEDRAKDPLRLFQFEGPYDIPEKQAPVTRKELNLPESRPVFIIVGNRLDAEIDAEFLTLLETLVTGSQAFVFFLGKFETYRTLAQSAPALFENSENRTFHSDLMSVYDVCDVYITPRRIGGGSSAVYAMAAGVPVLSLMYGDIRIAAQHFPEQASYETMAQTAILLASTPETMKTYRQHAAKGSAAIKDSAALVGEFLSHMDRFHKTG